MSRAGIALGSNLGDRLANLREAWRQLLTLAVPEEDFYAARIYQTEPRFCPPGSPNFLNTVVEIEFDASAIDLLRACRGIEKSMGRERGAERNAPRVIDLDLLYVDDDKWATEDLELPHPRISERRFVLEPLAEIRPELVLPGELVTVGELLAMLPLDEAPLEAIDEGLG